MDDTLKLWSHDDLPRNIQGTIFLHQLMLGLVDNRELLGVDIAGQAYLGTLGHPAAAVWSQRTEDFLI